MKKERLKINILLGLNIRKYRELKGLTQEQLIELIDIDMSSISDIERGKRQPKPETVMKIAEVLDVSYDMLYKDNSITKNDKDDYMERFNRIKNNPEKFNILYNILKIIS